MSSKKNRWTNHLSRPNASALHKSTLASLKEAFPHFIVRQEYPIEAIDESGRSRTLYLDFYIADIMLAIECHGEQHFKENPFFHSKDGSFKRQQENDRLKKKWCDINDVSLIEITHKDKPSKELIMRKLEEVL